MCSAGGGVEYRSRSRSRSRGRGRSRSQRAGARSSPVNGSKQGTGPLARNGGWLQRQTLSSPRNRRATSAHRVRRCNAQQLQRGTAYPRYGGSWSPPQRTVPPLQRAVRCVQFWCEERLLLRLSSAAACSGAAYCLLPAASRRGDHTNTSTRYQHATELRYLL